MDGSIQLVRSPSHVCERHQRRTRRRRHRKRGPNATESVLAHLVDYFKITYPVGFSSSDQVDAYLGREGKEVLKVPQMVVIDRKGVIRATSGTLGDPALENESSLRAFVEPLLSEKVSPGNSAQPAPAT